MWSILRNEICLGFFFNIFFWPGKGMNDIVCSLKLWKINLITFEDELMLISKSRNKERSIFFDLRYLEPK